MSGYKITWVAVGPEQNCVNTPTPLARLVNQPLCPYVQACSSIKASPDGWCPQHLTSAPSHIWESFGDVEGGCWSQVEGHIWEHVTWVVRGLWRRWPACVCVYVQVASWDDRHTKRSYFSVNTFPVNRLCVESREPWPLLLYSDGKR